MSVRSGPAPLAIPGRRVTLGGVSRHHRPAALLAALLALAVPAPGRADLYAALSGGVTFPSGTTAYGALRVEPAAALALGYDTDHLGGALWVAFMTSSAGSILTQNCWPVLVRVRGRLPLGVAVPFAFGAVGLAPSRALLNLVPYDTVAFAGQAGAGIDLFFGDLFTIGAEGGWQWLRPTYDFGALDMSGGFALGTLAVRFP